MTQTTIHKTVPMGGNTSSEFMTYCGLPGADVETARWSDEKDERGRAVFIDATCIECEAIRTGLQKQRVREITHGAYAANQRFSATMGSSKSSNGTDWFSETD